MKFQGGKCEQFLFGIRQYLARFLFPRICVGCKCEGAWLCPPCLSAVPVNRRLLLRREYSGLDGVMAVSWYADRRVQSLIRLLKYHGVSDVCASIEPLVELFLKQFSGMPCAFEAVTAVPLHKRKLQQRGFNQADFLAAMVARKFRVAHRDVMRRSVFTVSQTAVEKERRGANVAGAFEVVPGVCVPERVLLVDDVVTSGATLGACAAALRAAGARQVYAFVLATDGG